MTTSKIFPLNDSRTICQLNVNAEGDGIYNCPSVLKGTYLAIMTKPGCDVWYWPIDEIRAWSREDIANSATLLEDGMPANSYWLLGPANLNDFHYYNSSSPWVVDLGFPVELKTVYISFYGWDGCSWYQISTGNTAPMTGISPPPLSNSALEN